MGILVKPRVSFSSYPLHPASPQATPRHHHPLTDSLFNYPVSTRISQRLNPAWTQVTGQPDLSPPAAKHDLSPNLVHDLTWLTEQLNPDVTSVLPHRVPLGQATPHASCCVMPMLNLTSDNPAYLAQLTLWPNFPLPPRARTKARKKFFSQKIQTDSK
jgi:hypothetical protein